MTRRRKAAIGDTAAGVPGVLVEKRAISRMAERARWLVRMAATALAAAFAWLKLKGVPVAEATAEPGAVLLLRLTLVLYYFSWIAAVAIDTRDEEDVLLQAPNRGNIPVAAVVIVISISVAFGLLCWVRSFPEFVAALAAFWVLNVLAWRYLMNKLMSPAIEASASAARERRAYFEEQRVVLLREYLDGRWQWARFGWGTASLLCLAGLCVPTMADAVRGMVGFKSSSAVGSAAVLTHLLLVEGWVWWRRLEKRIGIRLLERVELALGRGETAR
jgi:hypothetical protein